MTDRDLLERAAKAAGMVVVGDADRILVYPEHRAGGLIVETQTGGHKAWNGLTDDGDAFRLDCKLKLNIIYGDFSVGVTDEDEIDEAALVKSDEDRCAVVRRLIVRAAAAMAGD